WDILGEGEVKSLAQLSTDHWNQHKRPLRVAIDEAGWRFHNLSDAQVAAIRQKVPEANPIEKAILWRVLKLMRMNIQPIFIFDGPSRPWKRGDVAGRIDWKKIDSLRKMLNHLKISHHRAPAEAEAECARLSELGIVDAVWTDDGDAFMFGAKVLIK
ncbi:PIN domain-like protein, partial [Aureobasidium namibiae CBS 147.97]